MDRSASDLSVSTTDTYILANDECTPFSPPPKQAQPMPSTHAIWVRLTPSHNCDQLIERWVRALLSFVPGGVDCLRHAKIAPTSACFARRCMAARGTARGGYPRPSSDQ
jgi:hypothetical protein